MVNNDSNPPRVLNTANNRDSCAIEQITDYLKGTKQFAAYAAALAERKKNPKLDDIAVKDTRTALTSVTGNVLGAEKMSLTDQNPYETGVVGSDMLQKIYDAAEKVATQLAEPAPLMQGTAQSTPAIPNSKSQCQLY